MEIELKYKIESNDQMDAIWNDEFIASMEEKDSREELLIKAVYFDTEDFLLQKNQIAFRVRLEGTRMIGTLKWRDHDQSVKGLYMREEINVPLNNEEYFIAPSPAIFKQSEVGRDLMEAVGDKPLRGIFETVFLRRKMRIETGNTICEVALDKGEIIAKDEKAPISELEIELYAGKQEDLLSIGEKISKKYDLTPELKSKYARAISLFERTKE